MNEDNGIWVNNKIQMVDYVADFLQNWLEDSINENLEQEIIKTAENLSTKEDFELISVKLFEGYLTKRLESFEEQLNKLQTIEE